MRALWNVRYRGTYNAGDNRDGVKVGMFWLEETGDKEFDKGQALEAAQAWMRASKGEVRIVVAVWPTVLFDAEEVLTAPKPASVPAAKVAPIPVRA